MTARSRPCCAFRRDRNGRAGRDLIGNLRRLPRCRALTADTRAPARYARRLASPAEATAAAGQKIARAENPGPRDRGIPAVGQHGAFPLRRMITFAEQLQSSFYLSLRDLLTTVSASVMPGRQAR